MRIIAIALLISFMTGCVAETQVVADTTARKEMSALDVQCKNNMTEWCRMHYADIQERRSRAVKTASKDQTTAAIVLITIVGLGAIAGFTYYGVEQQKK